MREDNVATEVMNALAECVNACALLTEEMWKEQRAAILDGVSWFVEASALVDDPNLRGPKDMIRSAAAIAAKLQTAIVAWDGTAAPPPSLVSLARELHDVVMQEVRPERYLVGEQHEGTWRYLDAAGNWTTDQTMAASYATQAEAMAAKPEGSVLILAPLPSHGGA